MVPTATRLFGAPPKEDRAVKVTDENMDWFKKKFMGPKDGNKSDRRALYKDRRRAPSVEGGAEGEGQAQSQTQGERPRRQPWKPRSRDGEGQSQDGYQRRSNWKGGKDFRPRPRQDAEAQEGGEGEQKRPWEPRRGPRDFDNRNGGDNGYRGNRNNSYSNNKYRGPRKDYNDAPASGEGPSTGERRFDSRPRSAPRQGDWKGKRRDYGNNRPTQRTEGENGGAPREPNRRERRDRDFHRDAQSVPNVEGVDGDYETAKKRPAFQKRERSFRPRDGPRLSDATMEEGLGNSRLPVDERAFLKSRGRMSEALDKTENKKPDEELKAAKRRPAFDLKAKFASATTDGKDSVAKPEKEGMVSERAQKRDEAWEDEEDEERPSPKPRQKAYQKAERAPWKKEANAGPRSPAKFRGKDRRQQQQVPAAAPKPYSLPSLAPTKEELRRKRPEELAAALASAEYMQKATPECLIDVLDSLQRSTREMPAFRQRPEIQACIDKLAQPDALKVLPLDKLARFVAIVVGNKVTDQKKWIPVAAEIVNRKKSLTLPTLSFMLCSLKNIGHYMPIIASNDSLFFDLEAEVIRLVGAAKEFDPTSVSKIIKAYAKTENGSEDFYRLMEKQVIVNIAKFTPTQLANVLSYVASSKNSSAEILKACKARVLAEMKENQFRPSDLAGIARAYADKKMVDPELMQAIAKSFLACHTDFHFSQTASIYKFFVQNKAIYNLEKIWGYLNTCAGAPLRDIEIRPLADFFCDWTAPDCHLQPKVREAIRNHVNELLKKKKDVSKSALAEIYKAVKDEKMEPGMFNVFAEGLFVHVKDYI